MYTFKEFLEWIELLNKALGIEIKIEEDTRSELEKDVDRIKEIEQEFKKMTSELNEIRWKYKKSLFSFLKK